MRENHIKYHGVFPALYACYDGEGAVSAGGTAALARHLVRKGVAGLYVGGSSGECIYLSVRERMRVLEAVMEAVGGRCVVIAHVACMNTEDSRALARHAQRAGADAIAAIPPIYFRLPEHAIAGYWNAISDAAPQTDFILYNIPQLAGVALTAQLYREMLKNPRVAGVKSSSLSAQDIWQYLALGEGRVAVFSGADEQFVSGLAMGAQGGIGGTYAVMPELFLRMEALLRAGDLPAARALQFTANDIIADLSACRGSLYAAAKRVLLLNEGLELGGARPPLPALEADDLDKVKRCAAKIRSALAP